MQGMQNEVACKDAELNKLESELVTAEEEHRRYEDQARYYF